MTIIAGGCARDNAGLEGEGRRSTKRRPLVTDWVGLALIAYPLSGPPTSEPMESEEALAMIGGGVLLLWLGNRIQPDDPLWDEGVAARGGRGVDLDIAPTGVALTYRF
jgi:hypothetical protein